MTFMSFINIWIFCDLLQLNDRRMTCAKHSLSCCWDFERTFQMEVTDFVLHYIYFTLHLFIFL